MSRKQTKPSRSVKDLLPRLLLVAGVACLLLALLSLLLPRTSRAPDRPTLQTETLPDTNPPTQNEIDSHVVPANQPRIISIPKIQVNARVFSLGLDAQGRIDIPRNTNDAGWYNQSAKPGQPGATVIDGHVSSLDSHGVFYDLKALVAGDSIMIERGDGSRFSYRVVTTRTYDHDKVDMQAVLTPIETGKIGLNLITCGGKVMQGTNQYNKRVVVFAVAQ